MIKMERKPAPVILMENKKDWTEEYIKNGIIYILFVVFVTTQKEIDFRNFY